jgi:hypothetical protein
MVPLARTGLMLNASARVPNTSKDIIIAETVFLDNLAPSPDHKSTCRGKRFMKETSTIILIGNCCLY